MQNKDCCGMYCFNYKYKSYIKIYKRIHKYCIDKIESKMDSYNTFIKNCDDTENYTLKTFESSPEWNIDIDI